MKEEERQKDEVVKVMVEEKEGCEGKEEVTKEMAVQEKEEEERCERRLGGELREMKCREHGSGRSGGDG